MYTILLQTDCSFQPLPQYKPQSKSHQDMLMFFFGMKQLLCLKWPGQSLSDSHRSLGFLVGIHWNSPSWAAQMRVSICSIFDGSWWTKLTDFWHRSQAAVHPSRSETARGCNIWYRSDYEKLSWMILIKSVYRYLYSIYIDYIDIYRLYRLYIDIYYI